MSWYTEEEIEKLLEDEELRKRIARFVTMSGKNFSMKCTPPSSQRKNWKNIWKKTPVNENI